VDAVSDLSDRIFAVIDEARRHAEEVKAAQPQYMSIGLSLPDGRSLKVTSDPDIELRRCEADKRTVERHSEVGGGCRWPEYSTEFCAACGQTMPCPDLQDRAAAWNVEVPE